MYFIYGVKKNSKHSDKFILQMTIMFSDAIFQTVSPDLLRSHQAVPIRTSYNGIVLASCSYAV